MKTFNFFAVAFILTLSLAFVACDNTTRPVVSPDGPVVTLYAAGHYQRGDHPVACYWVNGKRTALDVSSFPESSDSEALVITVSDNNVYIAGWYDTGALSMDGLKIFETCYWKNGILQPLDHAGLEDVSPCPTSISVSGGNVLIAGYAPYYYPDPPETPNDYPYGVYWLNGDRYDLGDDFFPYASGITGNKVFTVGKYYYYDPPQYNEWVAYYSRFSAPPSGSGDQILYTLGIEEFPGVNSSVATALAVSGNRAVAAGCYYNPGTNAFTCYYWQKDNWDSPGWEDDTGTFTTLNIPNNAGEPMPKAVFLSGANVYTAGTYYDPAKSRNVACYWENASYNYLESPESFPASVAQSITRHGNDVYVSGYFGDGYNSGVTTQCYWKNGVRTTLSIRDAGGINNTFMVVK